ILLEHHLVSQSRHHQRRPSYQASNSLRMGKLRDSNSRLNSYKASSYKASSYKASSCRTRRWLRSSLPLNSSSLRQVLSLVLRHLAPAQQRPLRFLRAGWHILIPTAANTTTFICPQHERNGSHLSPKFHLH